ncbi:MAG: hypothetical protein GY733_21340 [bacterium]|nr:hypothetical protein [bacterium]MCP5070635.1 hypothetical protein [bacterium]
MSTAAAAERGIEDGQHVRVHNDVGSFEVHAVITPTVRKGQVIVYHAWEPNQFRSGSSHQTLIPSPMNPIHLAGGYTQLQPTLLMGEPGCPDRGTRVDVSLLDECGEGVSSPCLSRAVLLRLGLFRVCGVLFYTLSSSSCTRVCDRGLHVVLRLALLRSSRSRRS